MRAYKHQALALAIAAIASSGARAESATQETEAPDNTGAESEFTLLGPLVVYGEPEKTKSATKLGLSIYETPQTVSVISRDQMDDFSLRNAEDVLRYTPGVTVERVETDRTYYTARGFDIVNFQYDGVGVPFSYGLNQGHDDSFIYEQVEVVKGATGLITGLANPSATINFVRKRPTDETQAHFAASAGSWDYGRVEADVSGQLIEDRLKGRLVVARKAGDSYMDRYSRDTNVFYGVLTADLTDFSRLTIGHSINDGHSDGTISGGLPLFYADGGVTSFDRSTNTATDWAYQDVKQTRSFVEYEHDLNDRWMAKLIYTHAVQDKDWDTFYTTGAPDRTTGLGLSADASRYKAQDKQNIFDMYVTGTFDAWGQEHELVVGANYADIDLTASSRYASAWHYDPLGSDWAEGNTPRPEFDLFDPATQTTDIEQDQTSYYISTRLRATDKLAVLLGARTIDSEQSGISYGADQDASVDETVPYAGLTYEALPGTMLYGSYSKVFQPQTWVDSSLHPLGAVEGDSWEVGIKQELFDSGLVLTLAHFGSHQDNFGEWESVDPASGLNIYRGVEYDSKGFEIELAGQVTDNLSLSAGFTALQIDDVDGHETRTYIPTRQFKLATSYRIPSMENLRIGGGVRWQNEIYYNGVEVQDSYALVDLFAKHQLTDNVSLALNINNLTNEEYFESPQWGQVLYGEPRRVLGTLTLKY
ncbi:TonB-dependent siderophore receptor [Marinobacterium mangrovicola]|uniref:Outer membrane receptor for ferric coprogen and ferric-rhodotorulic acid n=1 Tax=Marinobacterium mangrovicola TaxID=1476959 RepID=A0A4R1GL22_9GAMM|nr:TonB-dependent siderophore receptor [Marinobacterium mangrovicola]TCK09124.1 outer membrane receptor for ferric coprogen and ferric-rhodotorulic acid [Marinobacterium mangrovicola]